MSPSHHEHQPSFSPEFEHKHKKNGHTNGDSTPHETATDQASDLDLPFLRGVRTREEIMSSIKRKQWERKLNLLDPEEKEVLEDERRKKEKKIEPKY